MSTNLARTLSLSHSEVETLQWAIHDAIRYAEQEIEDASQYMDQHHVEGYEIEIYNLKKLGARLGMSFDKE